MARLGYFDGVEILWEPPIQLRTPVLLPTIAVDFADVQVPSGQKADFTAIGVNAIDGYVEVESLPGVWEVATGGDLSFNPLTGVLGYQSNNTGTWHDGRRYRVVFVNGNGEIRGAPATVTVTTGGGGGTLPQFSDQVIWLPTSVSDPEWERHTAQGHQQSDLQVVTSLAGVPVDGLWTKVTHHNGDRFPWNPPGGHRAEWRPRVWNAAKTGKLDIGAPQGEESWMCWGFYVAPGTPNPDGWGRITGQLHAGSGSPSWAFRHDPSGQWLLDIRGPSSQRIVKLADSLQRGHLYKIKVYQKSSGSSDGRLYVWIDGVQVVHAGNGGNGPNRAGSGGGYLKFGIYGGNSWPESYIYVGGWLKSRNEADIDLMLSTYPTI